MRNRSRRFLVVTTAIRTIADADPWIVGGTLALMGVAGLSLLGMLWLAGGAEATEVATRLAGIVVNALGCMLLVASCGMLVGMAMALGLGWMGIADEIRARLRKGRGLAHGSQRERG